ncbi:MAG: hypothetical protein LPJ87_07545 [Zoogloeaceae bacterium]|nr:hypothetical protein [Zoogloeaceae bacterium]
MRFGLVVTDERHGDAAIALLEGAQARGWSCRCFLNDRGVLLLADPRFTGSPAFKATQVAVCELSVERHEDQGLRPGDIDSHVVIGGQYQDAELVKNSDRVLVL